MAFQSQDDFWAHNRRVTNNMIAQAIRDGTHKPGPGQRVCPQCREWCDSLYDAPADGSQGRCIACHVRMNYPRLTVQQFQLAVRRGEAK